MISTDLTSKILGKHVLVLKPYFRSTSRKYFRNIKEEITQQKQGDIRNNDFDRPDFPDTRHTFSRTEPYFRSTSGKIL